MYVILVPKLLLAEWAVTIVLSLQPLESTQSSRYGIFEDKFEYFRL